MICSLQAWKSLQSGTKSSWHGSYNTNDSPKLQPKANTCPSQSSKTPGCQISAWRAESRWSISVMERTFSFQCAAPYFSSVSIRFIFQTMTISPLPALYFKMPRGRQCSGSCPDSITSSGSRSTSWLACPCLIPVCVSSNVLFSPRPGALGQNRSYLCWKSSSNISATSRTILLIT